MAALRVVDLSYNSIVVIEPNTFTQDQLHILKINVANNNLREVDFTNVMLEHKYCYVSYENNQIHDIVNQLNYTFDIDEGFVNISTSGIWYFTINSLSRFPDPAKLGLPSILYFAFLKNIWLRLGENPIYCDCSMYPLLKGLIHGLKSRLVKLDAEFLGCVLPSHLSYLRINRNFKEEYLYNFICNYTSCPSRCVCYYQPYLNRTVIDCSKAGLADRLDISLNTSNWRIPYQNDLRKSLETNIEVVLSNNACRRIPNTNFLSRTSYLDLSANDMRYIQETILRKMPREAVLNISHNTKLKSIPIDIRRFKVENVNMSGLVLACTCDDKNEMYKWLPDWLLANTKSGFESNPMCSVDGRLVDAKLVTPEYLGCRYMSNISMLYCFCLYLHIYNGIFRHASRISK